MLALRSAPAFAALALVFTGSRPARADAGPAPAERRGSDDASKRALASRADAARLQLGLGAGFVVGLGDAQTGSGDAIGFEGPPSFLQLSLAPSYRVVPAFAVGLRASYGFELGSRGATSSSGESLPLDRSLWEVAVTLRYQAEAGRAWYLALSGGAAALVDSEGDASVSQWAVPALGAAVGYDVELASVFSLGVEARATYADFSGEGARLSRASGASRLYRYDTSAWLGLAVVGTLLE